LTPQVSAVCRLVSFWNDYSRAVVLSFVVPCCFLGSGVLLRKGADVLEGDLTQRSRIRDALTFERSWLDSAVVYPGNYLCYFNCGRVDDITTKGPLQ
jgi:hypothetical protein